MAAEPRFLFGAARSGTNALTWALEKSGELAVFNEDNPKCFVQFMLMDRPILDAVLRSAGAGKVFFKSFHDTPRARVLFEHYPEARAVYSIRNPLDCIGSFVQAFGESGAMVWLGRFEHAATDHCGFALQMCRGDAAAFSIAIDRARYVLDLLRQTGASPANIAAGYYLWAHGFHDHIGVRTDRRFEIVDYADLVTRPQLTLSRVSRHLGIDDVDASVQEWSGSRGFGSQTVVHDLLLSRCLKLYETICDRAVLPET